MRKATVLLLPVAAMLLSAALAGEPEQQAVRTHCEADTNLPAGICDCLVGKAAEMTEDQQALLAAMATGDDAEAARLRGQLPPEQLMQVGMFYVNEPRICAGG